MYVYSILQSSLDIPWYCSALSPLHDLHILSVWLALYTRLGKQGLISNNPGGRGYYLVLSLGIWQGPHPGCTSSSGTLDSFLDYLGSHAFIFSLSIVFSVHSSRMRHFLFYILTAVLLFSASSCLMLIIS